MRGVLIESDWNLKGINSGCASFSESSINRIRLEFKVCCHLLIKCVFICINRIRLEFKGYFNIIFSPPAVSINRIRLEFKVERYAVQ